MYSSIKKREQLEFSAVHLFEEIENIRNEVPENEQELLLRYVCWNGYSAHPESVILAMISMFSVYSNLTLIFLTVALYTIMLHPYSAIPALISPRVILV